MALITAEALPALAECRGGPPRAPGTLQGQVAGLCAAARRARCRS